MKYLKVWTDFESILAPLTDDEVGRLFLAMLHYAGTGEEPTAFSGNESFLWAVAKRDIDTMEEKSETLRQNGLKGGRPRSRENQTKPEETKQNQTEANESLKEKKRNEKKGNETKSSLMDDDEAHMIQAEQNRVMDAAQDAGFINSNSVRAALVRLYADYGLEKMLKAIESCVKHSAPNLAYLEACLANKPRKVTPQVVAQDFEQRDYSSVQDEMLNELSAELADFRKGAG